MIKRVGTLVRIEGTYAILRWTNGSSFIPRRFLPEEARIGDLIIKDDYRYYIGDNLSGNALLWPVRSVQKTVD